MLKELKNCKQYYAKGIRRINNMKAVFPASFDPFTYGHDSVIQKTYPLFNHGDDVIYIIPSINRKKQKFSCEYMDRMGSAILNYYKNCNMNHIKVVNNYGDALIGDICEKIGAEYIIRGVRDTSDFLHESEIAQYNEMINPKVITLYVRGRIPISSSFVRELIYYGKPIREYVPDQVADIFEDPFVGSDQFQEELRERYGVRP